MPYEWAWRVVPRALPVLFQGLRLTLLVTVVVITLGFLLGILVAAGRLARNPLINKAVAILHRVLPGNAEPSLRLVRVCYLLPIVLGLELPSFASIVARP